MDHSKSDTKAVISQLEEISSLFQEISNNPQMFLDNYKEWITQRKQTISSFKNLKEYVGSLNVVCNIAGAVSEGTMVAGGVCTVAGIGVSLLEDEDSKVGEELITTGVTVATIGAVGKGCTAVVNTLVSNKHFNEAKACLKQDEDSTAKLFPFLQNTKKLNDLFKTVFECDLLSNTWLEIIAIFEHMIVIKELECNILRNVEEILFSGKQNCCSDSVNKIKEKSNVIDLEELSKKVQCMNNKTQFIIKQFCTDSGVREAVQNMCNSYKQSPEIFKIAVLGSRINLSFSIFRSIKIYPIILSVITKAAMKVPNVMFQFLLKAIEVSKDVIEFLNAVNDIQDKKSEYYELLKNTEYVLTEELEIVKNAYETFNTKT